MANPAASADLDFRPLEGVSLLASSEAGRADFPGVVPPRRSILWPALVIGACTLALAIALRGRTPLEARLPLAATFGLANLISAVAAFARAGERPTEARGWRMLGGSLALLTIANLAAGLAAWYPAFRAFHNLALVSLGVLSQGLATAALLCMPWKSADLNWRPRNLLGSCLFVGSILLILWTLTNWEAGFGSHNLVNLALLAACARVTLLGGVTLMLLEQDARRIRGVLGFILASVLLGGFHVALLQNLLVRGWLQLVPLASVYAFTPLVLGLAAWSRAPLEFPVLPTQSAKVWVFLPYATFATAAAAILLSFLATGTVAGVPLVGFIVLTWLLLARQFLLLRETRMFNRSLEDRVVSRTRDLEAMQAAVLRTERLNTLASLGAGIAHDLNNFLGVIQSSVEMLQEGTNLSAVEVQRNLARIHISTGRAAALTGRLLGFARTGPGPRQVLDLAEELERQEDLLRILLPTNIRLRMELAPGPLPILSRKSNLERILVNLVSNAKDAMPNGGAVTIRLEAIPGPDPQVRFRVEDSGPGLPAQVLEHLFEFFTTTKGEGKGTGLGLATVNALVKGDEGTVTVQSGATGCRFTITYPMALAFSGAHPHPAERPDTASSHSRYDGLPPMEAPSCLNTPP